ncbi:MAG: BACON domain-containing protein [Bacteroidales bacterium]|nr:BACON domain-containing protein [Bacteroidales bacterium]
MKNNLVLLYFIIFISPISFGQKTDNIEQLLNTAFEKGTIENIKIGHGFGNITSKSYDEFPQQKRETNILKERYGGIPVKNGKINDSSLTIKNVHIISKEKKKIKTTGLNKSSSSANDWILNNEPSVVFPSANASSFINEAKAMVSNYTGKLNYKIPLFSLKSYDIELPISLSYNTSGAKVDEIASWVGLGWTLNAGGCITRVMKGLPDEYKGTIGTLYGITLPAYGYLHLKNHPDHGFINIEGFPSQYNELFQKRFVRNAEWENLDGFNMGDGLGNGEAWDTQGDEFYFNFSGYAGKFVFDQNGNILTLPHNNFKITKTSKIFNIEGVNVERIVKFDVITPDGYKYTFGDINLDAVETTINIQVSRKIKYQYPHITSASLINGIEVDCWYRLPLLVPTLYGFEHIDIIRYNTFPYSSTWYLKKITSPTGDEINFYYEQNEYLDFYITKRGHSIVLPNLSEGILPINGTNYIVHVSLLGDNLPVWHKQEVTFFRNEVVHKTKLLTSIVSKAGNKVELITSPVLREDNLGSKKLEYLKIYDHLNHEQKSYKFLHSYSQPEQYQIKDIFYLGKNPWDSTQFLFFEEYDGNVNDILLFSEQKRLFLDYIYEYDSNGDNNLPPYRFVYNLGIRPRRGSYKTDKYGYFNNNNRGTNIRKISYLGVFSDNVPKFPATIDYFFIWDNLAFPVASYYCEVANSCESCAKAGILEKIITPTLGSVEFSYESNKKGSQNTSGLRVSSIKEYPNALNNSEFIETNYTYSGGATVNTYKSRYSLPVNFNFYEGKNVYVFSSSVVSDLFTQGCVVGYDNAKIQKSTNGYSVYTYYNPTEIINQSSPVYHVGETGSSTNTYPYPIDIDMDWKRGLMKTFDQTLNDGSETYSKNYTYDLDPTDFTKKYAFGLIGGIFKLDAPDEPNVFPQYYAGKYKYELGWFYDESETIKYYSSDSPGDESKAITKIVNNVYEVKEHNNEQFTFLKETSTTASNGKEIKTKTQFPLDITNPSNVYMTQSVLDKMKEKNMLNTPLIKEVFVNVEQKEGAIISYDSQNGNDDFIKPSIIRKYENIDYEIKSSFDRYDNWGNLLQFHKENNIYTSYYWGYNGQYPIIQADNINYDALEAAIDAIQSDMELFLENLGDLTEETQRTDWEFFNISLREALLNSLISSYTYNPLIGITSKTDFAGNTIYYNYDNFSRLQTTRDQSFNIVEHIDYNYYELIDVNPKIFNLNSNTGTEQVEVITDLNWNVSENSEWISILPPSSGTGDGTFSFSYSANSEFGVRSGLITVSSTSPPCQTTIVVNQTANPFLYVEPVLIEIGQHPSGEIPINVSSNTVWTVFTDDDWISINPTSGQFNNTFYIQCAHNPGAAREGSVIVEGNNVNPVTIIVSQLGHP